MWRSVGRLVMTMIGTDWTRDFKNNSTTVSNLTLYHRFFKKYPLLLFSLPFLDKIKRRCKIKQQRMVKEQGFPIYNRDISNAKKRKNLFLQYSNMLSSANHQSTASKQQQILSQFPNLLPQTENPLAHHRGTFLLIFCSFRWISFILDYKVM